MRKELSFPALLRSIQRSIEFHKVVARTVDAFDPGGNRSLQPSRFILLPICNGLLTPQPQFAVSRGTRADVEERSEGVAATGITLSKTTFGGIGEVKAEATAHPLHGCPHPLPPEGSIIVKQGGRRTPDFHHLLCLFPSPCL